MNSLNFESINQALKIIEPIAREVNPQALDEYKELYKEKSGNQEPLIMIYGMYSHGKSTLVNALLGRESAKMDITPTTAAPDKYKWENADCILLDTPGISAKGEHTNIAKASAKANELVVFVVESGSFEGNVVWNEIINLVKKGQKTCLIINDFDNCMSDIERSERLKNEFRIHLQKAASQAQLQEINIVEKVPLRMVNAKMALKGRLENKPQLVERSGIYETENLLIEMVKDINLDDIILTLKRNLLLLIGLCRISLAGNSGNESLQLAEEQLHNIKVARDDAFMKIENELLDRLEFYKSDIRALYNDYGSSESELKKAFSAIVEKIAQEMEETFQTQINKASKTIEELCTNFNKLQVQIAPEFIQNGNIELTPAATKGTEIVGTITPMVMNILPKILPSTAKFIPYIGTIITIITTLFQFFNESSAEQQAIEQAQRKNEVINEAVENSISRLKSAFMQKISEAFNEVFDDSINNISVQVRKMQEENAMLVKQQETLDSAEQLLEKTA